MMLKKKNIAIASALSVSLLASSAALAAVNFKDVPASHWARGVIDWGVSERIIVGYPDGTFKPDQRVTEAEFLSMLIRAYKPQLPQIAQKRHWADEIYAFSRALNYPLEGYDDLKKRAWIIDRERVAEVIAGAYGYNYSGRDAIHFLLAKGIARGKDPKEISIEAYKGNDPLTRAEAVAFVQNVLKSGLKELKPRPAQPSDPSLLPPLPSEPPKQQPPVQQQPPAQQPPAQQPPAQQQPPADAWQPGDSRLLADAFFGSLRINGDGTVTVTIPEIPGYEVMAAYFPPAGSGEFASNPGPGTYTFKMGPRSGITVAMRKLNDPNNIEGYTVTFDGSWKVDLGKRVNGKYVHEETTLDAILRGLGLK